jgi:hypothetical protein
MMIADKDQSEWPRPMETCGSCRKDVLKQPGQSNTRYFDNEEAPIWMEMSNNHTSPGHLEHARTRQVNMLEGSM